MLDFAGGNVGADCFEVELFIVKSGPAILDTQLGYYEKNARGLEVLVGKAIGAKVRSGPSRNRRDKHCDGRRRPGRSRCIAAEWLSCRI